jgi:uncharacterized protein YprB with RNaseH-like and TPR domain
MLASMDLASKLSLYGGPAAQSSSRDVELQAPDSPEMLEFQAQRLEQVLPDVYSRTLQFNELTLGNMELSRCIQCPQHFLDDLLPSAQRIPGRDGLVHRDEVLFLDTETTSLSRGPANFPFLFGLAFFRGRSLHFEQYFLDGPGGEEAFQIFLQEKLRSFGAICTYNGKSFDIPVIRNRFILLGERFQAPPLHLDLYHFWKRMLRGERKSGFKQKDMEERILGFHREEDLPGSEVPQVYFDYRKYNQKEKMDRVLLHNEWDLLGLAFLFLEAIRIVSDQKNQIQSFRSGIARLFLKHGRAIAARDILEDLVATDYEADLLYSDRLLLGMLLKKRKEYERADVVFRSIYRRFRCLHSAIEMARHREHRRKDPLAALTVVEESLELVEYRGMVRGEERFVKDLMHRRQRLIRRASESEASKAGTDLET